MINYIDLDVKSNKVCKCAAAASCPGEAELLPGTLSESYSLFLLLQPKQGFMGSVWRPKGQIMAQIATFEE